MEISFSYLDDDGNGIHYEGILYIFCIFVYFINFFHFSDVEVLQDELLDESQQESTATDDDKNINDDEITGDEDLVFVKLLNKHAHILLSKSQTPGSKVKKKGAMDLFIRRLASFGFKYTEAKAKKKMENMKTRLKKKIDSKKTGNVPINLKPFEEVLMGALQGKDNPSITRLN